MIVATPNTMSVKPRRRSRIAAWSSPRDSPRMLYSLVRATWSADGKRDAGWCRGVDVGNEADSVMIVKFQRVTASGPELLQNTTGSRP